jgi:HPt (histidine-containing phosphotransfer) domain-containing protein
VVTADLHARDAVLAHHYQVKGCLFKPLEFRQFQREIEVLLGSQSMKGQVASFGEATMEHSDLGDLERKLQRLVLEQLVDDCVEMREALRRGDRSRLRFIAHRILGSAGNAKLHELAESMRMLEQAALSGDEGYCEQLIENARGYDTARHSRLGGK